MALRKPLVVANGQVQEISTGDSPWTFTIGIGDASNAAASTQFVTNAVGRGLVKDVGAGGTTTLNATEAANTIISVTGALTSNAVLEVPTGTFRIYAISNETTGAFSLSIKQASASPVAAIARGKRNIVVAVGNGVYDALTDYESIVMTGSPLAPTQPTSADGFEVANTAFVKAAIAAAPAPAGASVKQFYLYTANTTLTVPAGVSVVRFYAGGAGGNGFSQSGAAGAGGAGGGFAFGDLAVSTGDSVSITIASRVTTVRLNGVVVGTANPGGNATGTGVPAGGTASVTAAVTNGGAYSGGAGGNNRGGGGSCGSPLGAGFAGGGYSGGGGGIGGVGATGLTTFASYCGGAGAGEAGGLGGSGVGYGGGSAPNGMSRGILNAFQDPLLAHARATRNQAIVGAIGAGAPGAGGSPATASTHGAPGGDFGGGGGGGPGMPGVGGAGGLMGGGGGGGYNQSGGGAAAGGAGGYGGGGGGAAPGSGPAPAVGAGGDAFCFLYY